MAKFVMVTTNLMRRIFSKVGGSNKTFQDVEKGMEGFLTAYKGSRGKLPPEGKWPVPKSLFDRLAAEAKVKPKTVDASIKAEGFEADTANDRARGRSKRGRIESRESRMFQRSDGTFGATFGGSRRTEGTRELDERELRSRRIQERKAANEGKTLNRTMKVTRRTLEEDTF